MHAQLDAFGDPLGDAQVFDRVTQFVGVGDVLGGDAADAFGEDFVELQGDAEGDGGQDHQFVRGVDAFHVKGGVGFGVAQLLGFFQHFGEAATLVAHLGEDEVAGAVDDAREPFDPVGREAFADGFDDGDTARDGRFKGDGDAFFIGGGKDFVAVLGDQCLVGGDHVLAVFNGGQNQLARVVDATDQLDQDIDVGVFRDFEDIFGDVQLGDIAVDIVASARHLADDQIAASAGVDDFAVARQHVDRAAAYRAEPTDAYFDRFQALLPCC